MSALATRAHLQAQRAVLPDPTGLLGETAQQMPGGLRQVWRKEMRLTEVWTGMASRCWHRDMKLSRMCVCGDRSAGRNGCWWCAPMPMQTRSAVTWKTPGQSPGALLALTPPVGRGKRQITQEAALQSAAEAVLTKHRVTGLLTYTYTRESEQEIKFVGRGRGGTNRQQQVSERVRYQITVVQRNEQAIAHLVSTLGWRAYASNAPRERLSLADAVREYRHEYRIEQGFGRLKGAPLSIAPMFVKREDQVVGLTHLLTIAVRVLTLMEFVVRRSLKQQGATLVGLHKENTRKASATPTAERLLQAFVPITLTQLQLPAQVVRHVTPLTALQLQILALLGLPPDLYASLAREIPQTAFPLRE